MGHLPYLHGRVRSGGVGESPAIDVGLGWDRLLLVPVLRVAGGPGLGPAPTRPTTTDGSGGG